MAQCILTPSPTPMAPDPADRDLLANVRPPGWVNPRPADRYDLVVLGGGTAGLVAAAGAAGLGARVALVERGRLGGDCLNFGCVPSKGMIRAARAWKAANEAAGRFGGPTVSGRGDFGAALGRMRRLRAEIGRHDAAARFTELGVDVFFGDGRFTGRDTLEVDGEARLSFRRAVIATGARPAAPPIPGLAEVGFCTNETIFDLQELPRRLAVVGAGPIGTELAQAFARFGSEVTVVADGSQVLPREDADAAAVVARALVEDGVALHLAATIEAVVRRGPERVLRWRRDDRFGEIVADEILVATGRAPNVEGLGLEQAGVGFSARGVEVDERLRTANRRIFAAGDVASHFQFTHAADAQARIVLQNAFFFGRKRSSALVIPWVTYTSPELAHVGLYEREADEQGLEVETLTVPLAEVDRARLDGEDAGFLRLHLRRGTDRILGATLVAEHAGETIGEITLAITQRIGLGALAHVIHPYPTQAEVLKKAADTWRRGKLTPRVRRLLGAWFRLRRLVA
jgi:mercury(II) reductase